MIEVHKTDAFALWIAGLRDRAAVARINMRLARLATGNPGDARSVGEGVSELRIDHGPGYRVYFTRRGPALMLLLCGGDKRAQAQDIERAKRMVRELRDET